MSFTTLNARLGLGALIVSALLAFIAIPTWVSSPSNVSNVVLSPTFWPYILSALLAVVGLGLILSSRRSDENAQPPDAAGALPWLRLMALAMIMAVTMVGLNVLGMVWTSMLAFVATALMFRTRYPFVAVICAVLVPLVLYAFFAHVAGVAIPQGQLVRLP